MLYLGVDVVMLFVFAVLLCTGVVFFLGILDVDEDTGITIMNCVIATATVMVAFYMAMCVFLQ